MTNTTAERDAPHGAPAPTGHSRFGASSSERWLNCPGSVRASEGCHDEPSVYAQEGTALHAVAALCLTNEQDALEYVDRTIEGVDIDEEHAEAVQVYVDTIRADKARAGGKLLIERRFHLAFLHPEFFGTSDCGRIGSDGVLTVYDAKFGRGVAVEVAGNSQLAYYALGMAESLPKTIKVEAIELVVIQPRAFHRDGPVRRVRVSHMELLDLCQDLVEAAKLAESPSPSFKAGDWCRWCRAAGTCATLRNFAIDTAQLDFDEDKGVVPKMGNQTTPNPLDLTPEQLAHIISAADIIEDWIHAVRFHSLVMAQGGTEIPGYKLVAKRATRKWRDETEAAGDLSLVFGLDESSIFKQKLLSPAQVEKLLPKSERDALETLYSKVSSGNKLVKDSAPGAAVASSAQTDFDD